MVNMHGLWFKKNLVQKQHGGTVGSVSASQVCSPWFSSELCVEFCSLTCICNGLIPPSKNMQAGSFFTQNWPYVWSVSSLRRIESRSSENLTMINRLLKDEWLNDTVQELVHTEYSAVWDETWHTCTCIYQSDLWTPPVTLLWSLCLSVLYSPQLPITFGLPQMLFINRFSSNTNMIGYPSQWQQRIS